MEFYFFRHKNLVNASGYAYGNPKFAEGTWINTSVIKCAEVEYFPMPEPRAENGAKVQQAIKEQLAVKQNGEEIYSRGYHVHVGTFEQSEEPSYDIFDEKENVWYKHVREAKVVARVSASEL